MAMVALPLVSLAALLFVPASCPTPFFVVRASPRAPGGNAVLDIAASDAVPDSILVDFFDVPLKVIDCAAGGMLLVAASVAVVNTAIFIINGIFDVSIASPFHFIDGVLRRAVGITGLPAPDIKEETAAAMMAMYDRDENAVFSREEVAVIVAAASGPGDEIAIANIPTLTSIRFLLSSMILVSLNFLVAVDVVETLVKPADP